MQDSTILFKRACDLIPGGVNSPVRAFQSVGGTPIYVTSGKGTRIQTCEGRELLDFCGSWGPLILGHANEEVVDAVRSAAGKGLSFGINTPGEIEMADLLCTQIPYMDMVRLMSSGTEATMTALRLARGVTGRRKILKFAGCYHGHTDYLLVAAGSGLLTGGIASSAGVSPQAAAEVLVVPYNDIEAVAEVIENHGDDLAAVILEPVAGNMGLVQPVEGFLQGIRDLTEKRGILMILDEVISGFRLAPTTYGALAGIVPDLTCLGKIIGGGMPIGAIGGKREIMMNLAPVGPVYQAGTLSGNPVAVAAGLTTIRALIRDNPYPRMEQLATQLVDGLNELVTGARCCRLGGMFTLFFGDAPFMNLDGVKTCDTRRFASFFHGMLDNGIYLSPSQFELDFVSAAHTEADVQIFLDAAAKSL